MEAKILVCYKNHILHETTKTRQRNVPHTASGNVAKRQAYSVVGKACVVSIQRMGKLRVPPGQNPSKTVKQRQENA